MKGKPKLYASAAFCAMAVCTLPTPGHAVHPAAAHQQCSAPYSATRDRRNPLDLPKPPGRNPLAGAKFFVPGPAKGSAARAIAQMVGLNPDQIPVDESWADFASHYAPSFSDPAIARNVALLSKVASQPEAQRISSYSEGGGPGAIYKQTRKIFCQNLTADPGSIPIFSTYFLHPAVGGHATRAQLAAAGPVFRRRVNEMAAATGNRPSVWLLEVDGIGSSKGFQRTGALGVWEADLRYEALKMASLPHTVVYLEAGYSDGNSARYTARVLNRSGVRRIRGFYTNDTHENWTINEVRWASAVSKRTHHAHYIVNTADNGRGPKLNRNRVKYGNEDLCNPPGRGLGIPTTTNTRFKLVDAFMWEHPPGNSSGHCHGGPSGGVFWPARAEGEAARADRQLGPGYPRRPY